MRCVSKSTNDTPAWPIALFHDLVSDMYSRTISQRIDHKSWRFREKPKRILAIRLQAMGDVVITLPYLQSLKNRLPDAELDLLTRTEVDDIPRNLDLFHNVFSIGGGRSFKKQILMAGLLFPRLWARQYDVVADLQRHPISEWIRKLLRPPCWSEFDPFSPLSAGERTRLTIEALALGAACNRVKPNLRNKSLGLDILKAGGWNPDCDLIALNPAGGWPTKNWPLENYVGFAKLWLSEPGNPSQFIILGLESISSQARFLKQQLGDYLINLVNRTSPAEAYSIVQRVDLVVSEDSGLMHMAWTSGIPTVALFGASRSDWSAPLGDDSLCLNSADLPCGECMKDICQFGDVHCLIRYTPGMVFEQAQALFKKSKSGVEVT